MRIVAAARKQARPAPPSTDTVFTVPDPLGNRGRHWSTGVAVTEVMLSGTVFCNSDTGAEVAHLVVKFVTSIV